MGRKRVSVHHAASVAYALFMGQGLVLVAFNDLWLRLARLECAPLGMPVAEAFPHPVYRHLQRAMREVYRSGRSVQFETEIGPILIVPYRSSSGQLGVVTRYQPTAVPLEQPLPALGLTA